MNKPELSNIEQGVMSPDGDRAIPLPPDLSYFSLDPTGEMGSYYWVNFDSTATQQPIQAPAQKDTTEARPTS